MRSSVFAGLVGAAVFLVLLAVDAHTPARAGSWCAILNIGATNCGFTSAEQCRASLSGIGGSCYFNPAADGGSKPAEPKRSKRKQG
jgi:hypothetical protein